MLYAPLISIASDDEDSGYENHRGSPKKASSKSRQSTMSAPPRMRDSDLPPGRQGGQGGQGGDLRLPAPVRVSHDYGDGAEKKKVLLVRPGKR